MTVLSVWGVVLVMLGVSIRFVLVLSLSCLVSPLLTVSSVVLSVVVRVCVVSVTWLPQLL